MYEGKDQVNVFRMKTLLLGLRLEVKTGMKLTNKAPSAYTIIKKEYGLKGNKISVYNQFLQIYNNEVARVFPQPEEGA